METIYYVLLITTPSSIIAEEPLSILGNAKENSIPGLG
jgi:hypothetical protein